MMSIQLDETGGLVMSNNIGKWKYDGSLGNFETYEFSSDSSNEKLRPFNFIELPFRVPMVLHRTSNGHLLFKYQLTIFPQLILKLTSPSSPLRINITLKRGSS